ncbi:hypothetical protein M3M33_17405, partial [Loigolactobacillus coryniformis]|uniref:hypothetical protein n=1 Tax=Loigolactobacillus coryniformis TaxID=1610 RepID=UPI00201AE8CD
MSDERRAEILRDCARKDTHFICHKSSMTGGDACCRGFYDDAMKPTGRPTQMMRIAGRLDAF